MTWRAIPLSPQNHLKSEKKIKQLLTNANRFAIILAEFANRFAFRGAESQGKRWTVKTISQNHVTMTDVARHLGISKTTVSHALSGKRPINAKLRAEILSTIEELGFRPNFAARIMNTRRTGLIGLLVENLKNPHTTALLEIFSKELERYSLQTVLATTENMDRGRELIAKFSEGMVDGILNFLPGLEPDEAKQLARGVPCVTYLRHAEAPLVLDYSTGLLNALSYLRELGHRKIAFVSIGKRAGSCPVDPCLDVYLQWEFCPHDPSLIFTLHEGTVAGGLEIAEAVFSSSATAVFTGNDAVAAGLYHWAHNHGIRIPDRLSIVGGDNTEMSQQMFPPLTTLDLPVERLALHTVHVLLAAIIPEETLPEPVTIIPELVIRNSTAPIGR